MSIKGRREGLRGGTPLSRRRRFGFRLNSLPPVIRPARVIMYSVALSIVHALQIRFCPVGIPFLLNSAASKLIVFGASRDVISTANDYGCLAGTC